MTGSQTGAEAAVVLYESRNLSVSGRVSKDDLKYIKSGEVILKGADEKEITGAKVESVKRTAVMKISTFFLYRYRRNSFHRNTAEFTISQDAGLLMSVFR